MSSNKIQKALLVIFIGLSLVLATVLTILFVRGEITEDGIVTNTGILRIQTDPENITYKVYVDNINKDIADNKVKNLVEGEYIIKIMADGYNDWEKRIIIYNGVVTDIFVKLYSNSLSVNAVTKTNIDKTFMSQDGNYIYYTVTKSEFGNDYGIWRVATNQNTSFFSTTNLEPTKLSDNSEIIRSTFNGNNYRIIPNNENSKIILADYSNNKFHIFNAGEPNKVPILEVTKTLGFIPDSICWLNGGSNILIASKGLLFDLNISTGISTLLLYRPSLNVIYSTNGSSTYVIDNVEKKLYSFKNQRLEAVDLKALSLPENIDIIKVAPQNDDILIIGSGNNFYYLNLKKLYLKKVFEDLSLTSVQLKSVSNDGTSALFMVGENECYTFNAKENIAFNNMEIGYSILKGINCKTGFIEYAPQSTHLVYFSVLDSTIKTIEPDGANISSIITDVGFKGFANFNSRGDYILILLEDLTIPTLPKTNIYRVQLEK